MNLNFLRRHFLEFARGVVSGHPRVRIDRGVRMSGPGTYDFKRGSALGRDARMWVGAGATFTLGEGSKIGPRNIVNVESGLTIGRGTEISWNVQILDTDFHTITIDESGRELRRSNPVVIGDHVLIGTAVLILKGVTIGNGSIVGAGAVVRHDVPDHAIVAGNPAQVVGDVHDWR